MISSFSLYIGTLIEVIIERVLLSFSNVMSMSDWLNTIVLLVAYALIAFSFGFSFDFLQLDPQFAKNTVLRIIATSLFAPAILEELLFRVILLPQPSENMPIRSILAWSIISLFLFVIYHPFNAITFFPNGRETFFNPVFLSLATLLGLICTAAYLQTASIWSPVFIHWVTVIIWLLCLGGVRRLKMIENEY